MLHRAPILRKRYPGITVYVTVTVSAGVLEWSERSLGHRVI